MRPLSDYASSLGTMITELKDSFSKPKKYTRIFNCVERKELKHIGVSRNDFKKGKRKLFGLALSGGGIRSASFGMGVLQALVDRDKLEKIDYMSTVSGGGYIGSALTWFLRERPSKLPWGKSKRDFAFGRKGYGAREMGTDNSILDFIRQHSNYLVPGNGLNMISLVGIAIRTVIISLLFYIGAMSFVFAVMKLIGLYEDFEVKWLPIPLNALWTMALILIAGILASAIIFSLRTFFTIGSSRTRYSNLISGQKGLGTAWAAVIVLVVLGSLWFTLDSLPDIYKMLAAVGVSAASIITGVINFIIPQSPPKKEAASTSSRKAILASIIMIYALMMLSFSVGLYLFHGPLIRLTIFGAGVTLFGWFVNLNYAGPHRNYRNRLMETFLPNDWNVENYQWGAATEANTAPLKDMCKGENNRPYHIINTNVVLVDSPDTKFRGRGGDSFILSPLYCGSDATGWRATEDYRGPLSRGLTLATAMAISGAAANPYTGAAGRGVMRNMFVSILMSILNLRLGYWASNPRNRRITVIPPNFLYPGLGKALFGKGQHENSGSLQLTDGGHFENLGIYELLRRKVDVIIASDATADPDFKFGDLANAVERARVDFGVVIRFNVNSTGLENLISGSADKNNVLNAKYQLAKKGYAVGTIQYPVGKEYNFQDRRGRPHQYEKKFKTGILIYIKSTLVPGLPADIYGYKSRYDKFPDQSTADQFFDESQFEAYRELGYQLTCRMLDEEKDNMRYRLGDGWA